MAFATLPGPQSLGGANPEPDPFATRRVNVEAPAIPVATPWAAFTQASLRRREVSGRTAKNSMLASLPMGSFHWLIHLDVFFGMLLIEVARRRRLEPAEKHDPIDPVTRGATKEKKQ